MKIEHEGQEIEVYTADEVVARETAAKTAAETEFKPKLEGLEKELGEARTALGARAGEFAQFRKLSDDQLKQLTEKDRIIYENQLSLQTEREKNAKLETERKTSAIDAAIKARTGSDEKLFAKVKEAYGIVQLKDETPEQLSTRVMAALGVASVSEPSLAAQVTGFTGGSYAPPQPAGAGGKSFADTEAGKAGANELGLTIETPKQ